MNIRTARSEKKRAYRMTARRQAVERTREQILRAAYELWLERPYDEVTMDAIAAAAGVTRQTVLRQFGSKEKLAVATADWQNPREEAQREVAPGDIATGIRRLIDRYEVMGDANVRLAELQDRFAEVGYLIRQGRRSHRGWIERVFAPYLPAQRGGDRERAVLALYAATDVMTWKLLRRDFRRSRALTEATMMMLADGVLYGLDTSRDGRLA